MPSDLKKNQALHSEPIVSLLDNLPLPACLLDSDHNIRFANRCYVEYFGMPHDNPCHLHLYDRMSPCLSCPLDQVLQHGKEATRQEHPGNSAFDVHYLPAGTLNGLPMVLQLWQTSTQPVESYTPFKKRGISHEILDALPEHIAIIDRNGTITMTNRAWNEFIRRNIRQAEQLYEGGNYLQVLETLSNKGRKQQADLLLGIREVLSGTVEEFSMEIFSVNDGKKSWFLSRATRLSGVENELHVIISHAPITELKKAENEVQKLAYFDNLTGLPNRLMLNDRLLHAIDWAHRQDESIAVLFLDLDHFKEVNDSLGHDGGDLLLKSVARRLTGCTRKSDTVSRLGGDEFIILLANIKHFGDVTNLANKVLHALSRPFKIKEREVFTSTSIGISFFPDDADTAEKLIRNADLAMYQAKERGRNAYMFFSDEMNEQLIQRREMQNALRDAVKRNEFTLFYQDQIDLKSDLICGVEALLRWQHPTLGLLSPHVFLEIAEETGLIVPIGNWVLKTACEQNVKWENDGLPPLRTSVNLSSKQLYQTNLAIKIKDILIETGLDPARLLIEVTEGAIRSNFERAQQVLAELKELGIGICIDSFGSGFSSLAQLRHLPVDRLNIDHPFIREITNDSRDTAIIRSIITTAHNLGLKVMAEGVETSRQRSFLKAHGCDEIQGYNFLRPGSETEVTAFLQNMISEVKGTAPLDKIIFPDLN
jgi:diguanylate cyclase (GGDEF)-like protein